MVALCKCKEWIIAPIIVDTKVCARPCLVKHICLTASSGGAATALVYNGQNTGGILTLALSALTSTHFNDDFEIPIHFAHGLYVDIGSNVTLFVVQYKIVES